MHAAAVHLVRRGLEIHQKADYQLPTWGIGLLIATTIWFLALNVSMEYTFGRLVPTLVMVESPQTVVLESTEPLLDEKKSLDADAKTSTNDTEILVVKQKFVTRTLCSSVRHLRQQAGRFARYRGFASFVVYALAHGFVTNVISLVGPLPRAVAPIVAALVCANLATTWTHVAITSPSTKPWYKRVPGCQTWKKVAGPTLCLAVAKHITCAVPMFFASRWGLVNMMPQEVHALSREERHVLVWKVLSLFLVGLLMALMFLLPAKVVLTRVQASLIKEEEETIVPFDRTFDDRVSPGDVRVSPRDAWYSFGQESRMHLLKTYGKVMAMEVALFVGFAVVICSELVLIMGDDIRHFIPASGQVVMDGN